MHYIRRAMESRLEKYSRTYKAVLVTGARQVGKSTLLKKVFPERRYVSLDDPFLEEQAKQNGDMFLSLNPVLITIDEVQRAKELFRYIKIKCDESEEKGLFCLSGSQPFHLMEGVSESLSGRIGIIELSGLSMRELLGDSFDRHFLPTMEYVTARKETVRRPSNLWEIIHRGSYPEMADSEKEWGAFYADYVKTYLERDVRIGGSAGSECVQAVYDCGGGADRGNIELQQYRVGNWQGCRHGKTVDFHIGSVGRGLSFGAVCVERFKTGNQKPEIIFPDTGLACYLTRWLTPEALAYGAMNGAMFETFAISEILKSFSNEGLDYRYMVSYYRGKDKDRKTGDGGQTQKESEIDFVIEENGVLYPVEIKMNSKVTADMTAAFQVLDKIPEKKRGTGAVLCTCPQPGMLRENVLQIPIWYV